MTGQFGAELAVGLKSVSSPSAGLIPEVVHKDSLILTICVEERGVEGDLTDLRMVLMSMLPVKIDLGCCISDVPRLTTAAPQKRNLSASVFSDNNDERRIVNSFLRAGRAPGIQKGIASSAEVAARAA